MKVTLVSPYHGGSHKAWAEGYQKYSRLEVHCLTLPARFWKWRMHGGAVTLARRFLEHNQQIDLILATDMLDLTTFLALTRPRTGTVPVVLYMHENQLTYPLPQDGNTGPMRRQLGERDQHYAFVNYASMLAADHVWFNSRFHRDSFFEALPRFLKHFPENNELGTVAQLAAKSHVTPVGVDFQRLEIGEGQRGYGLQSSLPNHTPLVIWNQRWEYDKNPEDFFNALYLLAEEEIPFRLALCGQQYGKRPPVFDAALRQLGDRIIHIGHAPEEEYRALLWQAAVTVSTAHHEFFGISILEAMYCHTFPILPNRLSYPELIPASYHTPCLYQDQQGLVERLRWALAHPQDARRIAIELAGQNEPYNWTKLAKQYDTLLTAAARQVLGGLSHK
ncbi:MAG: DUF3524 domain-containing protein [Anaerolineae bacterium]